MALHVDFIMLNILGLGGRGVVPNHLFFRVMYSVGMHGRAHAVLNGALFLLVCFFNRGLLFLSPSCMCSGAFFPASFSFGLL